MERALVAVVSLPAGGFNPYAGVKTSILILDKALAKKTDAIAFCKVENDGFGLGAQRRAIEKNDLPQVQAELSVYLGTLRNGQSADKLKLTCGLIVPKEKIAANGDYNLSGERYREGDIVNQKWPTVELGTVARLINGKAYKQEELLSEGPTPVLRVGNFFSNRSWYYSDLELEPDKYCNPGDLMFAWSASFGPRIWDGPRAIYHYHIWKVEPTDAIDKMFLFHLLAADSEKIKSEGNGIAMVHATKGGMEKRKFPLPPLDVQKEIVAEIEGYQKVINGARAVLDNYRPHIPIHPDWPMVEIGELCINFQNGANFSKEQMGRGTKFVNIKDLFSPGYVDLKKLERVELSEIEIERKKVKPDDLLFVRSSVKEEGVGFPSLMADSDETVVFCGFIIKCSPNREVVLPAYLLYLLRTPEFREKVVGLSNRANITNISQDSLKSLLIPLPPLATQQAIVAAL